MICLQHSHHCSHHCSIQESMLQTPTHEPSSTPLHCQESSRTNAVTETPFLQVLTSYHCVSAAERTCTPACNTRLNSKLSDSTQELYGLLGGTSPQKQLGKASVCYSAPFLLKNQERVGLYTPYFFMTQFNALFVVEVRLLLLFRNGLKTFKVGLTAVHTSLFGITHALKRRGYPPWQAKRGITDHSAPPQFQLDV